ncbi:SpaA isopeptide-forming pilin-related protein [uncultured Acetatifactor sp.]|uniref:SpaA isopeptide-forming pilin-related protein n=1 Tax=uncultured Acetatifactor sp. TaxID=1671927 RepID=UPI002614F80E|nr:SpaA isopeptide-forming pilin-related protein [uncultured Acetatifactor sp.]
MKLHRNRKNRKKLLQRAFSLLIVLSLMFSASSTYAANAGAVDGGSRYEERLICGLEENGHEHGDSCYADQQILVCGTEGQDGHSHTDECYTMERTLICRLEEQKHVHTAECYEKVLACDGDTAVQPAPEHDAVPETEDSRSGVEQGGVPEGDAITVDTADTEQSDLPEEDTTDAEGDNKPEGDAEESDTADTEQDSLPEEDTTDAESDNKPEGDVEESDTADTEQGDLPEEDTADTEGDNKPEGDVEESDTADTEQGDLPEEDIADTEQDASENVEDLTEEEILRITEINEMIAAVPSQEEITESLSGLEADRDAWYGCHEELRAQMTEACGAYLELDEKLRGQIEGIEGLLKRMELRREIEADFLERPVYCEKVSHIHLNLEGCYDEEGNIVCEDQWHGHWDAMTCYDGDDTLVCEMEEHIHDGTCFRIPDTTEEEQTAIEQVSRWIADLPEETDVLEKLDVLEEGNQEEYETYVTALKTQVQQAYDAYQMLEERLQKHVAGAEYLLALQAIMEEIALDDSGTADNLPEWVAAIPVEGSQNGKMVLELRYGDKKHYNEQDAEVKSPHWKLNGYFDLYTQAIEGNLEMEDLTITFHFPKEYINPDTIGFDPFVDPEHNISQVKENGDYYDISITFPKYQQTGQIEYEFHMQFYGGIVPEDYELKVYATISCGEKSADTKENTYKPTYEIPKIVKYVNTNQYDSMSVDYTKVSASVGEDGVIEDNDYVSFWYKMGGSKWYFREYDKVTLTDTLPTYTKYVRDAEGKIKTDEEGKKVTETAIAQFDKDANPGWEISTDGETVSRILTTDKSCKIPPVQGGDSQHWRAANELEKKIQEAELKLKFPDCVIDVPTKDGFLEKDLLNHIRADFHPRTPSDKETDDIVEDSLYFTLTNQPVGAGFAKYNSSNVVMDTKMVREGLYRWGIRFENSESVAPLVNLKITDYELDERLKIHTLRLITENKTEYEAENRIARIEAQRCDGDIADIYQADLENPERWFGKQGYDKKLDQYYQELILDPDVEYQGFTVYMKDGYELKLGENIHIGVYTTFKEPDKKQYIRNEGTDGLRNVYINKAKTEYQVEGMPEKFYTVCSENKFSMIDTTENISIEKNIVYGADVSLGEKNKYWDIRVKGSLMDGKDYEDMRIIDLLPEAFTLPKDSNGERKVSFGQNSQCVRESYIQDNYKNTGRTAVILYLDVAEVRKILDAPSQDANGNTIDYVSMTLITDVLPDASVGTFTNEVWLLSDDFEPITTQASAPDIYDLDGDSDTNEMIRKATSSCIVKSPTGVYAEKLIAPTNGAWRKTGLFLGVGDDFRYKLCVINAAESEHKGLLVYDVLPVINDPNISNSGTRGSEYRVELSNKITPPEGYDVYYTTSMKVHSQSMAGILVDSSSDPNSDVIWLDGDQVSDEILAQVTAFKIVASTDETKIPAKGRVEFEIPVRVSNELDEQSYKILHQKESVDRERGTATYLISTNSFGYRVKTFSGSNLESNYVNAQIPFAGFVIKKVDAENQEIALSGATFKLERQMSSATREGAGEITSSDTDAESGSTEETWETIVEEAVSKEDGILSFRDLTEGTYRLTETKAPQGYLSLNDPILVTVTLNRETMEYNITIAGNEHAGNSRDPFLIENRKEVFYELPSTGGPGTGIYTAAGILLMMASGLYALYGRKKSRA